MTCTSFPRFQITVQINDMEEVNILHVGTSMDPQTPASVQVMENGEYQVIVLPIHEEMGILTGMEFSQIYTVEDIPTATQGKTEAACMCGCGDMCCGCLVISGPTTLMPEASDPGNSSGAIIGKALHLLVMVFLHLQL